MRIGRRSFLPLMLFSHGIGLGLFLFRPVILRPYQKIPRRPLVYTLDSFPLCFFNFYFCPLARCHLLRFLVSLPPVYALPDIRAASLPGTAKFHISPQGWTFFCPLLLVPSITPPGQWLSVSSSVILFL